MNRRIDWSEVKAAYVEGVEVDGARSWPVIADLAERFGASASTLKKRAMHEKWVECRNLFRTKVELARQEQKVHAEAVKAADFDVGTFRVAARLLANIAATLDIADASDSPLSVATLKTLSGALLTTYKSARLAIGGDSEQVTANEPVAPPPDLSSLTLDELRCLERAHEITETVRAKSKKKWEGVA